MITRTKTPPEIQAMINKVDANIRKATKKYVGKPSWRASLRYRIIVWCRAIQQWWFLRQQKTVLNCPFPRLRWNSVSQFFTLLHPITYNKIELTVSSKEKEN